ncbi:MAG: N-acetylmuramic acid 6-phosphate etherase [Anaerorhabdus sp.]
MLDLKSMTTEKCNENSVGFSFMSIKDAIELMHKEDYEAVRCIEEEIDMIEKVISVTSDTLENGGRIIYIGAGTSGRLGLLDAVECPPTFGVDYNTVVGIIAGGKNAFVKAFEGAEDSKKYAVDDLKEHNLTSKDVVIGVAASGRTPYVIGGLEYANSIGAKTAAVVCNKNSEISKMCPLTIEVDAKAEVLTGSTRLKAGTATKLILNMISTISMIRVGKIYKNYMVDVKMSNEKLVKRGINIVSEVVGCSSDIAQETLSKTNNNVKEAIVMLLMDCDFEKAKEYLIKTKGHIKQGGDND